MDQVAAAVQPFIGIFTSAIGWVGTIALFYVILIKFLRGGLSLAIAEYLIHNIHDEEKVARITRSFADEKTISQHLQSIASRGGQKRT